MGCWTECPKIVRSLSSAHFKAGKSFEIIDAAVMMGQGNTVNCRKQLYDSAFMQSEAIREVAQELKNYVDKSRRETGVSFNTA